MQLHAFPTADTGCLYRAAHPGLEREQHDGRVKKLPINGLRLTRSIYMIRHADKHVSPAVEAFLGLLQLRGASSGAT